MIRQRFRGVLGITVTACIPWTALGLLVGIVLRLGLIPGVYATVRWPIPGGIVTALALAGAITGIINGVTFSGLVLATERGKAVADLRGWRFALWGAVATAATLGLVFQSLLGAAIGGAVGAVAGIVALAAARRSGLTVTHNSSAEP
jgi:hypothetical protein